jgi:DNA-binding CsgD family transcriptional regulator
MPLAAYSEIVALLFKAVLDERLLPAALEAVAGYVDAPGVAYFLVNKLTRQVTSLTEWGCFAGSRTDYLAHYSNIDPFRPIQEEAASGSFLRVSECLPQSLLDRDEWYNDYVVKGGVCDVLGGKLHESASHMSMIGLHDAIGNAGAFPGDSNALVTLMAPLCSVARLHVGLIDLGYRSAITHGRLDHLAAGALFSHGNGRLIDTNAAGERILRIGDGLMIRNGHLCARRSFETTKLAYLIANAASESGPSAGCMLVARRSGRRPYVVRVAPVSAGLAGYDLPMAMILVAAPDEIRVSEPELAELYGLTPAESRVAVALAQGKRLADLVGEFGVHITTLRTQLSATLKKCGVRRQADLVSLVASIPVLHPSSH